VIGAGFPGGKRQNREIHGDNKIAFSAKSSGCVLSPQINGIAKDGAVEFIFKDFDPNFDINAEYVIGDK
jgi:hypothetical protein